MAQGSTRFEYLEKSIDDYIIEQQNKNTRAKRTTDVKLLIEFLREKHEEIYICSTKIHTPTHRTPSFH